MAQRIGFGQAGQNPSAQNPLVVETAPAIATQQLLPYAPLNSSAPTRVSYTRHATAGSDDDRIVAQALVNFWKIMAWAGGIALLCWIFFGGFQRGKASVPTSVVPVPAVATMSPTPVPVAVATPPPAPAQPQVVVIPVPQPVQQVVFPPSAPAMNQTSQIEARPLSDAERRNEALKERLRRRYGIQ